MFQTMNSILPANKIILFPKTLSFYCLTENPLSTHWILHRVITEKKKKSYQIFSFQVTKIRKSEDRIISKSLEKLFDVLNPLQKGNFSISTVGKCLHLRGTKNGIYTHTHTNANTLIKSTPELQGKAFSTTSYSTQPAPAA